VLKKRESGTIHVAGDDQKRCKKQNVLTTKRVTSCCVKHKRSNYRGSFQPFEEEKIQTQMEPNPREYNFVNKPQKRNDQKYCVCSTAGPCSALTLSLKSKHKREL
jgi:hypothetical protein